MPRGKKGTGPYGIKAARKAKRPKATAVRAHKRALPAGYVEDAQILAEAAVPVSELSDVPELSRLLGTLYPHSIWDDSASKTASRFFRYLCEFIPGELPPLATFELEEHQMQVESPIEFASMCAHHLLPFMGYAHVGYISDGRVLGLSKVPRIVEWAAHRPQKQEAMTALIANTIKKAVNPKGVMVVVEAIHTCACARGIRKVGMWMRTSLPLGVFLYNRDSREEFFNLVSLQGGRR